MEMPASTGPASEIAMEPRTEMKIPHSPAILLSVFSSLGCSAAPPSSLEFLGAIASTPESLGFRLVQQQQKSWPSLPKIVFFTLTKNGFERITEMVTAVMLYAASIPRIVLCGMHSMPGP